MNHNRPLSERELSLIKLYSECQLAMTPKTFYEKWDVNHQQIADICNRSVSNVSFWFSVGRNRRNPTPDDLRHLALMDFILEHFEDIPSGMRDLLCPRISRD
ncbi:helix-turn-helix domain-containing protein [Microcoleus sp. FACHB-SPT15]|uniref:helix-turn-helix domain-containing protein n=1 Tax=Microcoleus sp. FACHB-SPT15 TaxID=2692830 RepID=UPI00177E72F3|nr:helix-turn-helix domain-containing protein [Microcoleus sp. FACHB-SPT15]MBD1804052.1 helix-turn-helix domain-containing protein [Microcoleus sp. FACHB-SPT15]